MELLDDEPEANERKVEKESGENRRALGNKEKETSRQKTGMKEREKDTTKQKTKRLAIAKTTSRYFWAAEDHETINHDGSGLWFSPHVHGFRILSPTSPDDKPLFPLGGKAIFGIEFQSIVIDVPNYLLLLIEKIVKLGVKIVRRTVDTSQGLEGVVRDVRTIVDKTWQTNNNGKHHDGQNDILAVINCTGLSARKFVSAQEASLLFPIRGQTVLVKGEANAARSYASYPGAKADDSLYIIPRPGSGTTIFGGCKQAGSWDESVDNDLTSRILERIRVEGLCEELRTGKGRGFEVVSVQVGFRPGRTGGPRVELEGDGKGNGKVEGVWVVHSYGHGGAGYQNSVGSAERVVEIMGGLL